MEDILKNKRFLFLDRDGVINKRIIGGYVSSPNEFECIKGVAEAIAIFNQHFERIIVVTNQQGIGKGIMTTEDLKAVHEHLNTILAEKEAHIDAFYHCPKLVNMPNNCRKPSPAMGLQAQKDYPEIDFSQSLMVGDMLSDIQFAHALNMPGILIDNKHINDYVRAQADLLFPSLLDLAQALDTRQ